MKLIVSGVVGCVASLLLVGIAPAFAADLPAVKVSDKNKVLACATPGRLMAFTKARNDKLDAKFDTIAADYMRHGEELGVRWDVAYFQMLLETANLGFGGDVKIKQNNFAGLGATGNGERGESFKDVSTGVRAHLEHLVMYTGEKVANPVAERTRKVQDWGVLTEWQKTIKGPVTFAQLARKWAPPARKYAEDIAAVAESFAEGACKGGDPRPELVALARGAKSQVAEPAVVAVPKVAKASEPKVTGAELAKRAAQDRREDGGSRSGLGAAGVAKAAIAAAPEVSAQPSAPFTLINPAAAEAEAAVPPAVDMAGDKAAKSKTQMAAAGGAAKTAGKPAGEAKPVQCKVFTASYGGAKAIVIRADKPDGAHYTVLDVNEGAEAREAEAYINAYAVGGKQVGIFKSQALAMDKAFELCPEG
jgi:Mannosyl-glycoprotein endo-beta-N-acetylglucosaminidase